MSGCILRSPILEHRVGSRCCGGPGEGVWELGRDDDVAGEAGLRDFIILIRQ